jgi:hypothetical protein
LARTLRPFRGFVSSGGGLFVGSLAMPLGIIAFAVALIQVADDLVRVSVDHASVLEQQSRDLFAPGSTTELLPVGRLGRDLARDE